MGAGAHRQAQEGTRREDQRVPLDQGQAQGPERPRGEVAVAAGGKRARGDCVGGEDGFVPGANRGGGGSDAGWTGGDSRASREGRETRPNRGAARSGGRRRSGRWRRRRDSELTDATDELQNLLAQFNDTIDETRGKVKEEERAVQDLQLTIKAYKDKREVAMKRHGKLSAESEAQARRIADRGAFIRELVQRNPDLKPLPQSLAANAALSLGNESDIAEMTRAANEMRERASVRLDALRAAAESLRAKHRGEDDARGAETDAANRELAAAEESVRLRAETRDATRKRGEAIADELAASAVSDATLVDLTGRTDEAHRLYEERRAAGVTVTTADALEACAATLDSLDRQLSKLRGEQDRAAVAGENATKVRLKREELFAKEEACKTLFDSRQGRFADVFGDQPMPAPERVKDALRAVADRRAAAMETQRGEVSNATVAADSAAAARLAAHDALGRLRAEAAEAERKALEDADALALRNDAEEEAPVVADGPFAGFDAAVADVDLRLSNADENVAIYNNLQKVYTSFADRAEDTHQCPVCHHGLDAIDVFKEQMQTKCAALPGLLATTLAEAEVLRGKRARLQRLGAALRCPTACATYRNARTGPTCLPRPRPPRRPAPRRARRRARLKQSPPTTPARLRWWRTPTR